MKFSRRSFLQGVSATVASYWGWQNQSAFSTSQLQAYAATLNQTTSRKFALLIGINRYSLGESLKGCQTDVELQQELLIHRFGFQSEDIVTLIDQEATRDNILNTFNQHLQQASKDDVVVFHFSGYGRQVKINRGNESEEIVKSLIAYDTIEAHNNQVDDILLDTLISLAENLPTKKYSLILDTNFVPPTTPIQEQISLRSYGDNIFAHNQQILNAQSLSQTKSISSIIATPKNYRNLRNNTTTSLSGLVLLPKTENIAVEINTPNFNAGLLTYTLTQSLWSSFSPRNNNYLTNQINSKISLYSNQTVEIDLVPDKLSDNLSYHLPLLPNSQGIGLITETIEPNIVELKLLGLPLLSLINYGSNSIVTAQNTAGKNISIQLNSITGNVAKGTIIDGDINSVQKGLIVQELIRVIPHKLGLNIGLDNSLDKVEKVDATSALSSISLVSSVSSIGTNFVDYILDKNSEQNGQSYSLFSPIGVPLEYTKSSSEQEGIYHAVKRFEQFMYLDFEFAYKLICLTHNEYSSTLPVRASLNINSDNSISESTKYTSNLSSLQTEAKTNPNQLMSVAQNSLVNIMIENQDQEDLYCLLLEVNASKEFFIYNNPDLRSIKAGENKFFPKNDDTFKWFINSRQGNSELVVICAKYPFTKTFAILEKNNGVKLQNEQVIPLKNVVEVMKALLTDLAQDESEINNLTNDDYALNINNWVTFNFVYQVI